MAELLSVENLTTRFRTADRKHWIHAVDDVSISLAPGEIAGLVGESGCGKSTLGRSIVGLEQPQGGRIAFDGTDISSLKGRKLREHRRAIQYVFQDPYASLSEWQTIGETLSEALLIAGKIPQNSFRKRIDVLLSQVGMPEEMKTRFPRELSGGQRQRIAIARALAVEPRVLICDEPVSALDLSIRAQVMNLFLKLQKETGVSSLFIAHDLALVRQAASRIYVMYLGQIVEQGPSDEVYRKPRHPYTKALLNSIPAVDPRRAARQQFVPLQGELPSPINPPSGCRFRTRCPIATSLCAEKVPELLPAGSQHAAACHFPLSTPHGAPP